jgi:hypothetical protein
MLHELTPTECMSSSRDKHYIWDHIWAVGWDSVVGIATRYGLDGRGIESRWGARVSAPDQTGPGGPTQPPTQWIKRPRRGVDHRPHLAPRLKKE